MSITENVVIDNDRLQEISNNHMSIAGVTAVKFLMTFLTGIGNVIWYNLCEAGNLATALKMINT